MPATNEPLIENVPKLGAVLTRQDGEWAVVSLYTNGSYDLAKIPSGETAMTMGRAWSRYDVPVEHVPHAVNI